MSKILACGTVAEVGMSVEVIKRTEGFKKGKITKITAISGMVKNKAPLDVDLDRWTKIVECNGWMVNINSLKAI